jgi:hypothetical protein
MQLFRVPRKSVVTQDVLVSQDQGEIRSPNLTILARKYQRRPMACQGGWLAAQHALGSSMPVIVLERRVCENELRAATNPFFHPHHTTINLRHISALPPQPAAKGLADACAQQFGRLAKPPISAKTSDWDAVRPLPGHQLAPCHARKNH